jgi:inner membrane protein
VALRRPESIRLAALLVVAVFAADLFWSLVEDSTDSLAYALVDEPAHLATCAIALLVLAAVRGSAAERGFAIAALIASTAIDLDHLPHYLGSQLLMGAGLPRPYTHSLLFVALLLALGWALRSGRREVALGIAFGVAAHLLRDLATGPGVPFFWPFSAAAVSVPYAAYAAALLLATATVALSAPRRPARRRPDRRPLGARPLPNAGQPGGS